MKRELMNDSMTYDFIFVGFYSFGHTVVLDEKSGNNKNIRLTD